MGIDHNFTVHSSSVASWTRSRELPSLVSDAALVDPDLGIKE